MTDFLYTQNAYTSDVNENFTRRFEFLNYRSRYIQGSWGCLYYLQNNYSGFQIYENDHHIALILGGPILKFHNNKHIYEEGTSNYATFLIFERWRNGYLKPDEDLSGPFTILIIDKINSKVIILTDLMNFIPIWHYELKNNNYISSIPELISENLNFSRSNVDKLSLVEFISNGVITFPYSLYKNLIQLNPASIYEYSKNHFEVATYYTYKKPNKIKSIDFFSKKIRKYLEDYLYELTSPKNIKNIAYFLSGGEDSRLIRSILLSKIDIKAITLSSIKNAELKITKKISKSFSDQHLVFKKNHDNYFELANEAINLVGSSGQFINAHNLGLRKSEFIKTRSVILGGFASDRLFKSEHKAIYKKIPYFYLPDFSCKKNPFKDISIHLFKKYSNDIRNRQKKHAERLSASLGYESTQEWMSILPSSMAIGSSYLSINRRIFRSYEPFFDASLVKISSQISHKEKLNRNIFYKSFRHYFLKTPLLQHVDGWYPSLPSWINYFVSFPLKLYFLISRLIFKTPRRSGWCDWKKLKVTKKFRDLTIKLIDDNILFDLRLCDKRSLKLENFSTVQIFNLFQCNLILKKILNQKKIQ